MLPSARRSTATSGPFIGSGLNGGRALCPGVATPAVLVMACLQRAVSLLCRPDYPPAPLAGVMPATGDCWSRRTTFRRRVHRLGR